MVRAERRLRVQILFNCSFRDKRHVITKATGTLDNDKSLSLPNKVLISRLVFSLSNFILSLLTKFAKYLLGNEQVTHLNK